MGPSWPRPTSSCITPKARMPTQSSGCETPSPARLSWRPARRRAARTYCGRSTAARTSWPGQPTVPRRRHTPRTPKRRGTGLAGRSPGAGAAVGWRVARGSSPYGLSEPAARSGALGAADYRSAVGKLPDRLELAGVPVAPDWDAVLGHAWLSWARRFTKSPFSIVLSSRSDRSRVPGRQGFRCRYPAGAS